MGARQRGLGQRSLSPLYRQQRDGNGARKGMELKTYYRKLREIESTVPDPYVVVVSKETPDGGRAGVLTETPRRIAARMIMDGSARLSTEEEAAAFRAEAAEAQRKAAREAAAHRVQVVVVSETEARKSGANVPKTAKPA